MINGRINRVMEAARLEADRELQQRLLGVGQHGQAEPPEEAEPSVGARRTSGGRREPRGPIRVYNANPTMPTRWSQPVPAAQIESGRAHAHRNARARRRRRPLRPWRSARSIAAASRR